jgi:hypothetical protein
MQLLEPASALPTNADKAVDSPSCHANCNNCMQMQHMLMQ